MKTELQNQLFAKYPSIFREIGGKPEETCMAFGIECGDGWHDLIDALCEQIDFHVNWTNRITPTYKFGVVAAQVKEKFGSLRFYVDFIYDHNLDQPAMKRISASIERVGGMIAMAEAISAKTCGACGNKCIPEDAPFPRAQCDACRAEIEEANHQNSYFKENHK
jgi:hypothetical protein